MYFRPRHHQRGSVVVIVMVTLLFATFALIAFMERASVDLLVEQRGIVTQRLRGEAYSALETTLAVLEEFREVGQGLRGPNEGWSDPLAFAAYTPHDSSRTVQVNFEDESGKISLPRVTAPVLVNLFKNWGIVQAESEAMADALLGWMRRDHIYSTSVRPDYDQGPIPFEPPRRSLRSFHELAAIEKIRETFYDTEGRPNEYWKRFVDAISLLDFPQPNLNGAKPDTLAALGQFDAQQQQNLGDYLRGSGTYQRTGPGFFQTPNEAQRIAGPTGDVSGFATTISALRIIITVREGRTEFRLATVVAPQGSNAQTIQQTATSMRTEASGASAKTAKQEQTRPNAGVAANPPTATTGNRLLTNPRNLKYPFTLLEMRENDEIPPVPPPPAASLI